MDRVIKWSFFFFFFFVPKCCRCTSISPAVGRRSATCCVHVRLLFVRPSACVGTCRSPSTHLIPANEKPRSSSLRRCCTVSVFADYQNENPLKTFPRPTRERVVAPVMPIDNDYSLVADIMGVSSKSGEVSFILKYNYNSYN